MERRKDVDGHQGAIDPNCPLCAELNEIGVQVDKLIDRNRFYYVVLLLDKETTHGGSTFANMHPMEINRFLRHALKTLHPENSRIVDHDGSVSEP